MGINVELRDVIKDTNWYLSYTMDDQAYALIKCLKRSVEEYEKLIDRMKAEVELFGDPREASAENLLRSIEHMLNQGVGTVGIRKGFFMWQYAKKEE